MIPPTNLPLLRQILVGFIRNEVTKTGFQRVVLGLSGGVDSSLCAYLASEALGPQNVLGVMMPYQTSSSESLSHAELVVESLGIRHLKVDITPMVDAYFRLFPEANQVRRGTKMARERMAILYDQSAADRALVLGTSNKTELLLGYGTQYGDMASAVNPLGDLYKSHVWQLARHVGVPEEIIQKKPSADLWAGQSDEEELGFTYEEADEILYFLVDKRYSYQELVEKGYPAEFVQQVYRRMQSSQYKRRLPVIAKVSERTIDRDFRYSRDWGL
ncbi:MAG: NAD+ synthase [Candidatus Tectomicrobia bacterium]|uniref:NH(3)-dependent NAD(+) synthetase n=1 Tax=Tectimicrobiota bacterium TaxID=2528274 RepID=A0A932CLZ8_UNCTE|nr:NAD+ synthase [Candidatus Tectomicrobia bacterium]